MVYYVYQEPTLAVEQPWFCQRQPQQCCHHHGRPQRLPKVRIQAMPNFIEHILNQDQYQEKALKDYLTALDSMVNCMTRSRTQSGDKSEAIPEKKSSEVVKESEDTQEKQIPEKREDIPEKREKTPEKSEETPEKSEDKNVNLKTIYCDNLGDFFNHVDSMIHTLAKDTHHPTNVKPQVTRSKVSENDTKEKLEIKIEFDNIREEDLDVKVLDEDVLVVEAVSKDHEQKFEKSFKLPAKCQLDKIVPKLTQAKDGQSKTLLITIPKEIKVVHIPIAIDE